ncbi:MAG: hypothetical protein RLZZ165_2209 [Bacteroidota bacterium]
MPPPGDVLSGMEFVEAEGWEILPPESRSCCGASSAAGGKTLEVTPPPKISFFIQSLPSRRARFSVDCERGVTARWPPPFFRASQRPSREPGPAGVNARFNRSPLRSIPSHSVFFYRTSRGPVDGCGAGNACEAAPFTPAGCRTMAPQLPPWACIVRILCFQSTHAMTASKTIASQGQPSVRNLPGAGLNARPRWPPVRKGPRRLLRAQGRSGGWACISPAAGREGTHAADWRRAPSCRRRRGSHPSLRQWSAAAAFGKRTAPRIMGCIQPLRWPGTIVRNLHRLG